MELLGKLLANINDVGRLNGVKFRSIQANTCSIDGEDAVKGGFRCANCDRLTMLPRTRLLYVHVRDLHGTSG